MAAFCIVALLEVLVLHPGFLGKSCSGTAWLTPVADGHIFWFSCPLWHLFYNEQPRGPRVELGPMVVRVLGGVCGCVQGVHVNLER